MALHKTTFLSPESQFRSVLLVPEASSDQVGGAYSCSADPQPLQSNRGMHCLNHGSACSSETVMSKVVERKKESLEHE